MKKITLATVMMFLATALTAQPNIISTSFYSEALGLTKMVNVFLPPGYDANPDLHYPVIYYLHGWQGSQNEGNGVMNTAYTMINQGLIDPVIIVCAHNSPPPFGGSVYTNSILWGDYETYMVEDLCNWIEATYRAMPGKHYRAVFGMSMGGYGAFRYGILHRDQYCALASCAAPISFLEDYMCMQFRQMILQANQPGPAYFYNYATGGMYTQIYFLYYGAFAPNYNTPQTYINPAILEFPLDENGNYIDTILAKVIPHDIASLINQLTPENSPGIYFGCGTNDPFFLYPGNMDVKDSLDLYGIPYTFYSHGGGHTMPAEFTQNAFMFLDSLLMPPVIPFSCLPEGITFTTQAQIDNFQANYSYCTNIEGDVIIKGAGVTNLDGLSVLTSIGGNLTIGSSDFGQGTMLVSLTGLENLTSIGGNLHILDNTTLTNITGINNIAAGSIIDLSISNNTSLSTCEVQSICDYLAAPNPNGTIQISNNAPGCNSQTEVQTACDPTPGIEESVMEPVFSVYPNPLSDQMNITLALDKPNPVSLIMTNNLGQIVAFINENQYSEGLHHVSWNIANLRPGIYFLRLQIGDEVVIRKVVKY